MISFRDPCCFVISSFTSSLVCKTNWDVVLDKTLYMYEPEADWEISYVQFMFF